MKVLLIILSLSVSARATPYFVDYATGNDSNAGTSSASPWQHCPDDANATGVPGSKALAGDDVVNFKGGVHYLGKIVPQHSGTSGHPITYQGNAAVHGWGAGKAWMDGSVAVSTSVCTGNGTGAGQIPNANFAQIVQGSVPAGTAFNTVVMENGVALSLSTTASSNPLPFLYENTDYGFDVASGVTATATTDAVNLTDPSASYYDGAYFVSIDSGNNGQAQAITSYVPGTHTINYNTIGSTLAPDAYGNHFHYLIVNSPRLISGPGQYCIDVPNLKVYVWPLSDPNGIRIAKLDQSFDLGGLSYVTIDGFIASGTWGTGFKAGRFISTTTSAPGVNSVWVINCDFANGSMGVGQEASGSIYINGGGVMGGVTNATFFAIHGRGPHYTGSFGKLLYLNLQQLDRTLIYTQNGGGGTPFSNHDIEIGYITAFNNRGSHQNGCAVYGSNTDTNGVCYNVRVHHAKILDMVMKLGPGSITAQGFWNLQIDNCILEADQGLPIDGALAGCPDPALSFVRIYDTSVPIPRNTAGNASAGIIRCYNMTNLNSYELKGNVCAGAEVADGDSSSAKHWGFPVHKNNRWLALGQSQTVGNGWALDATEAITTSAAAFNAPASGDWSPKAAGPLVDTGLTIAGIADDLLGVSRPQGSAPDIGALELVNGGGPSYTLRNGRMARRGSR